MATLVLTVVGDDRPGLVDALSGVIAAHDGNWEQSRMAHLAQKFAGILLVQVPDARMADLTTALEALQADGLLHMRVETGGEPPPPAPRRLSLALVGQDHPGIVHDIAHVLAERAIGIEELETETRSAAQSGGTLFHARAVLRVPADVSLDDLEATLEALANELMVDVELEAEEG
jgi:glycine cleavage system regulatory protein